MKKKNNCSFNADNLLTGLIVEFLYHFVTDLQPNYLGNTMQGVSDVTCVCKNSWVEWMIQPGKLQSGLPRLWYRDKIMSDKGCFSSLSGPWKRRLCSLEKKIILFLCLCLFKKKTTRTTKEEWKLTLSKCHMHKMMMRCGFLKIRWQIGHYSQFAI